MMKVLVQVDGLLLAVLVDLLAEISVAIKQPDGDKIQIEIAGRFAVVAGQDSQTTGIVGHRFVEAELRGKIGNRFLDRTPGAGLSVCVLAVEIFLEGVVHLFEFAQESLVLRNLLQPRLARELKHAHRIMIRPIPQLGIEMAEETAGSWLPRPPKIEGHLAQRFEPLRQGGSHIIGLKSRHKPVCQVRSTSGI